MKKRRCPLTTIDQLVKGAKYRKLPHRDRMIWRVLPTYHFYIVVKGAKWRIPESDRWWYRYLTTFAHLSQLTLPIIAEPAIQWITFHAMVHLQFTMRRPFTNHRSFTIHAFSRGAGASSAIENYRKCLQALKTQIPTSQNETTNKLVPSKGSVGTPIEHKQSSLSQEGQLAPPVGHEIS